MSEGSSKQTLCRLCLNIINDTDFEVIEEIITGILQDVFPRLDLKTEDKHIMCRTCHRNLIAAFNFKSMCIVTEDVIFSYVNPEQMPVVDVTDIYLKQKGNVQLTDMSKNQKICRLCMQLVTYEFGFVSLHEVDSDIINNYMPLININATKEPVICGLCFDSLHTHSSFVKNCLDAQEQYLQSYIKTEEIDIKTEESNQDSDSSFHNLFEGKMKNNKRKCVSEDAFEVKYEAPLNAPSAKSEYKNRVQKHLNHKVQKKYKCNECDYQTKYDWCLIHHLVIHKKSSKTQMYKCGECDFETEHMCSFISHQLKHEELMHGGPSETQMYKCGTCNYETKYTSCLRKHQLKHKDPSEVQMYKCNVCSYQTKYKKYLIQHLIRHKHPSETQMYKCDACSYRTNVKANLKLHQLTHKDLSEIQTHKCDVCSYEAKYKKCLNIHRLMHKDPSEIHLYKCEACSFETKYKSALTGHMLLHKDPSEVQLYKCDACNFATKYKSALKGHLLIHKDPSKIQMYKCDVCDYETKRKNNFKQHRLIHEHSSVQKCKKKTV